MRKAAGKRLPHGVTKDMVLAVMWRLYLETAHPEAVSRTQLVEAINLPETTIDDRLRVLVKSGEVLKKARGLYVPNKKTRGVFFDKYWAARQREQRSELLQQGAGYGPREPALKDEHRKVTVLPDGTVILQERLTMTEYLKHTGNRGGSNA